MICPACGMDNLSGAEQCESCFTPMTDLGPAKLSDNLQIRLLKETVVQLLPNKPVCVKPKDKLKSAIEIMNKMHLGCVLVHDGKELVGIFTERDALTKLGRSTIDLSKSLVQDYMTPNPEVIEESQSIAGALNKMSVGGYRHLPVIRGGTLTGVISIRDILRYFWE